MKTKPLLLLLLQSMMIITNKQKLILMNLLVFSNNDNKTKNQFNNFLFDEKRNNPDRSSTSLNHSAILPRSSGTLHSASSPVARRFISGGRLELSVPFATNGPIFLGRIASSGSTLD